MHEWCSTHDHDVVAVPPDSSCEYSEKSTATQAHTPAHVSTSITNATTARVHRAEIAGDVPERLAYPRSAYDTQYTQQTNKSTYSLEDGSICTTNDQIERGFTAAASLPSNADAVTGTHTSEQVNEDTRSKVTPILALASASTHTQVEIACSDSEAIVGNESSNDIDEISSQPILDFTSLVMITQEPESPETNADCLPSSTSSGPSGIGNASTIVRQPMKRHNDCVPNSLADYYTWSLDVTAQQQLATTSTTPSPVTSKRVPIITNHHYTDVVTRNARLSQMIGTTNETQDASDQDTGSDDLMVLKHCHPIDISEDGLADDDSWIDSADEVELAELVPMCTAADVNVDRASIDFTLHTIVEESCEESDAETKGYRSRKKSRRSASELERYYFFELADGKVATASIENCDESISDTSSLQSEVVDVVKWMGVDRGDNKAREESDSDMIISSRLEEYFMSTFLMPQSKVSRMVQSEHTDLCLIHMYLFLFTQFRFHCPTRNVNGNR